MMIPICIKKHI